MWQNKIHNAEINVLLTRLFLKIVRKIKMCQVKAKTDCLQVLELMKEVSDDLEEGDTSDISPYHSDSDSAVMMSGNSPFISKTARYNFLSRSVRMGSKHNVRASILASSLSEVNLELHSSRASTSTGPPSFVLHSSR